MEQISAAKGATDKGRGAAQFFKIGLKNESEAYGSVRAKRGSSETLKKRVLGHTYRLLSGQNPVFCEPAGSTGRSCQLQITKKTHWWLQLAVAGVGLVGNETEEAPGRREEGGGGVWKACGRDGRGEKGQERKGERKSPA